METKGREDLDDVEKIKRLEQWCDDVNATQNKASYKMLYVKQEDWEGSQGKPKTFQELIRAWEK